MARLPRTTVRRGLTLLELVLALSLAALVLMSIGMAIDMHYRMLDVRRTNVEESQLARASLRHIADDLKSIVQFYPPDQSGLDAVSQNMAGALAGTVANAAGLSGGSGGASGIGSLAGQLSGGAGAGGSSGTGSGQQPGGAQSTGGQGSGQATGLNSGNGGSPSGGNTTTGGGTTTEEDPAAPAAPVSPVKLYGTATELRFDISRLPRIDQYESLMTDDSLAATDIPSDVKSIVYFVRAEDSLGLPEPSLTGVGRGLMRTEIDSAVAAWAESGGDTTSQYAGAKLLAEEVTSIAFQYWDGAEWTTEWNSDDVGGLPVAVEVTITIQPSRAMTEAEIARLSTADSSTLPAEQTYKLVVHLPTAISTATRTLETDAEAIAATEILPSEPSGTETAGSGSSSGRGGSGGGGTGGGSSGASGFSFGGTGGGGFGGPGGGFGGPDGGFGGGRGGEGDARGDGVGRGGEGRGRGDGGRGDGGGRTRRSRAGGVPSGGGQGGGGGGFGGRPPGGGNGP